MTVFFVFPHPDDETIFAGGTIARHVARGDKVVWICAGAGERGGMSLKRSARFFYLLFKMLGRFPFFIHIQNFVIWLLSYLRKPNSELAEIRKREAVRAAKVYGISEPIFLEAEDMRYSRQKKKISRAFSEKFREFRPEIVYMVHPNGITAHPDHVALSQSVRDVLKSVGPEKRPRLLGVFLPRDTVRKYNLPFVGESRKKTALEIHLTEAELAAKLEAIKAYQSQDYLWKIFLEKHPELLKTEYFAELL